MKKYLLNINMSERPCGPKASKNNRAYYKYELIDMIVERRLMLKSKALKLDIPSLCTMLSIPVKVQSKPKTTVKPKTKRVSPKKDATPSKNKVCGPRKSKANPNVYSKQELVDLAILSGLLNKTKATKSTIGVLCNLLHLDKTKKLTPVHRPASPRPASPRPASPRPTSPRPTSPRPASPKSKPHKPVAVSSIKGPYQYPNRYSLLKGMKYRPSFNDYKIRLNVDASGNKMFKDRPIGIKPTVKNNAWKPKELDEYIDLHGEGYGELGDEFDAKYKQRKMDNYIKFFEEYPVTPRFFPPHKDLEDWDHLVDVM